MSTVKYLVVNTSSAAITKFVSNARSHDSKQGAQMDILYADGMRANMFISTKNEECLVDDDGMAKINAAIVLGFTTANQKLVNKPNVDGLSDAQKALRTTWKQQIASKRKDIKNALARREKTAEAIANGDDPATVGANARKSIDVKILERLAANLKDLEKCDGDTPTTLDIVELVKLTKAMIAKVTLDQSPEKKAA